MFYKHTHLLFLSLSLFSNSQILRSNKQTQSQQPCSPPHISPNSPNLKHHRHHHQLPPQRRPWFELVDPGREAWIVLAWVMLAWGTGLGRAGLGRTGLVALAWSRWPSHAARSRGPGGGQSVFFDF